MKKILFLAPKWGNGGILSWAKKYVAEYDNGRYKLVHLGVSKRRSTSIQSNIIKRATDGILDMIDAYLDVKKAISETNFSIFHATTSGGMGTVRDYFIGNLCKSKGIKTILHCHYGSITNDCSQKNISSWLLKKTFRQYDQIWVLDRATETFFKSDISLKNKVYLAPNFIDVDPDIEFTSKQYDKVAFVGNLIPSKGVMEVVQAVAELNNGTKLFVVGPGTDDVVEKIKSIAGNKLGNEINLLGRLSNDEAKELIKKIDILALPSYYKWEAFPISILEAMSYGKLVISTNRAAIPDMLTDLNGDMCGLIVEEKSSKAVANAILWCQQNNLEADKMCLNAFKKVRQCYNMNIVFDRYTYLYEQL